MVTMARSRSIYGPYESCPHNPVLTNRSMGMPIEATGHADLVQDKEEQWWAVCLGIRPISYPHRHNLGRETMLVPVEWDGEWPVFGNNGRVEEKIEVDRMPLTEGMINSNKDTTYYDNFDSGSLDLSWNFLYNPDNALWSLGKEGLTLYGNEKSLSDADTIAWIGRRQQHHISRTEVTLSFPCVREGEEAGITIFMNNRHHYEAALKLKDGKRKLIFRRQIGSLWKIENELEYEAEKVILELKSDKEFYVFSYLSPDRLMTEIGRGETGYLTTEVGGAFTGNYIALYSAGNGEKCIKPAVFSNFIYTNHI